MSVIIKDRNRIIISTPGPQGAAGAGGGGSGTVTSITGGTGLTGGTITTSGTLAVSYGTTAGTACEGNDSRLSDARTPTSHSHVAADIGSVLGPGLVGRSAASTGTCERIGLGSGLTIDGSKNLALSTTPAAQTIQMIAGTGLTGGGTLAADRTFDVAYGTTAGTACVGNDSRLSDARTPTSHTHPLSELSQSSATTGQVPTWNGSAWAAATPASGGGNTAATHYDYFSDFVTVPGDLVSATSGGSASVETAGTYGRPGELLLNTGIIASINQRAGLFSSNPPATMAFDDETSFEFVADANTYYGAFSSTSGEEGYYVLGFLDSVNQNADSDGAFFRSTDGGNWYAVTVSGGTETATDTGVATSTSYKRFRVEVLEVTGTLTARFYIDGTLEATHTTNIPTGSNRFGFGAKICRTGSTGNSVRLLVDWMKISIERTTDLVFT